MDNFIAVISTAILSSTVLQIAKNSPSLSFISRDTGRLNAVISVLVAGIGALGITYSYSYDEATGTFFLMFSGTATAFLNGLFVWAKQWGFQHAYYKGFVVPAEVQGETRAMLKEAMFGEKPQIKHEVPPQTDGK